MVLEGAYSAFGEILLVYTCGYKLVSDILVFLGYTIVFFSELVIDNLEVDRVAL